MMTADEKAEQSFVAGQIVQLANVLRSDITQASTGVIEDTNEAIQSYLNYLNSLIPAPEAP